MDLAPRQAFPLLLPKSLLHIHQETFRRTVLLHFSYVTPSVKCVWIDVEDPSSRRGTEKRPTTMLRNLLKDMSGDEKVSLCRNCKPKSGLQSYPNVIKVSFLLD